MKIGCYISELLDDHDFVVFPGLGAFIAREKSAQFDEKNEILVPPARQILFNEEIKVNDGILLNHFAHAEGIPAPIAHKELTRLCEDILYRLDHGETVELENLGKLSRISGKYTFVEHEELKKPPGAFGLKPVKVIGFKTDSGVGVATPTAEGNVHGDGIKVKPENLRWLAIFPILVIAFFAYWMFIGRNNQNLTDREKLETTREQQSIPSSVGPAPEEPTEHVGEEETDGVPLVEDHPQSGLYYLIGGSFKTRENADQYFEQMTEFGYKPVNLGEIGNFHIVAIAYFSSEREAVNEKNVLLSKDPASGVWIYYLPEGE